jgi:hypothetical protein
MGKLLQASHDWMRAMSLINKRFDDLDDRHLIALSRETLRLPVLVADVPVGVSPPETSELGVWLAEIGRRVVMAGR